MELLNHQNENWKYKYIAYTSVGKVSNYVDELKTIETMINSIFKCGMEFDEEINDD